MREGGRERGGEREKGGKGEGERVSERGQHRGGECLCVSLENSKL